MSDEKKLNSTGQYLTEIAYTNDPEELALLERPIGKWGQMWQDWMEAEHSSYVTILVVECKWAIIPRKIDIEAEKRYEELDKIYRANNPRPDTDFNSVLKWETAKKLWIEDIIMKEIVFVLRKD
jgi:hypothetical protein